MNGWHRSYLTGISAALALLVIVGLEPWWARAIVVALLSLAALILGMALEQYEHRTHPTED